MMIPYFERWRQTCSTSMDEEFSKIDQDRARFADHPSKLAARLQSLDSRWRRAKMTALQIHCDPESELINDGSITTEEPHN